MNTKKQRNFWLRFWMSLSLILCVVVSSFPAYTVAADTGGFQGLEDREVEETTQIDLLENVFAYNVNQEPLEVTVTSVICHTDPNFIYDGSNLLTVGEAGTEYFVEYLATSPTDENISYTGSRKIMSVQSTESLAHPESENVPDVESDPEEVISEMGKNPQLEPTPETEETTQDENVEFDENQPFTIADLEGMGYSVQMDGAKIPIENFELECLPEKEGASGCQDLHFIEQIQEIEGGRIKDHVPYYVANGENQKHSYLKAHVKNVSVYYVGKLHIYNDKEEKDYIYYTTDKQITNKTVYAVLNQGEKIQLQYKHDSDYQVDYKIINEITGKEESIGGWNVDDVFGTDRAYSVKKNDQLSVTVKIPRGYQATVYYIEKENPTEQLQSRIGDMMAFQRDEKKPNQIVLTQDSPSKMIYETFFNKERITDDVTIELKFKKVKEIQFNAYLWSQTAYAKGRIQVHPNETPNEQNAKEMIPMPEDGSGASFTWEWDGVTSKDIGGGNEDPMIDQGKGQENFHTWELDQLEINDEALLIPMISLNDKNVTRVERTVLDSGTEVTLSVTSKGGKNAYDGRRHYKLEIANCYEDITISGGNMVGHRHKEYVIREMLGVFKPEYYAATNFNGETLSWNEMHQDTKIAKVGFGGKNKWTDPFRFQRQIGFYKPEISFTTKEGNVLQKNGTVELDPDGDKEKYILYLNRTDEGTRDKQEIGTYKEVSYSNWKPSKDGYYYFRGTAEVEEFVGNRPEDAYKGVILVNINAYPIRIGLDYQNGADAKGVNAPKADDITNLPVTQYGGKDGYNLLTNQRLLMSNQVPVDKTNRFVFDHWEVLRTERTITDEGMWGYVTDQVKTENDVPIETGGKPYIAEKGQEYFLDTELLNTMDHCFYMKADPGSGHKDGNPFDDEPHKGAQTHAMVTVRAVWRKYKDEPTIPYIVKYILADVKNGKIDTSTEQLIEERTHTVNKGAKLVTDLYQDGNKTLSTSIQNILQGENTAKKDYTEGGDIKWVVYEPNTTMGIESVDETNNIATIYLIRANTKIHVKKQWASSDHKEKQVTVQLQRRKTEQDSWKTVENATLNEPKNWKHSFDAEQYYDLSEEPFKSWQYRVVEVNEKNEAVKDDHNISLNGHDYHVDYQYEEETNTWFITNTRLLDLTISKVVEGKSGDRTKEFVFDIQAKDSNGTVLNGVYNCIGSVKTEFETQSQKPDYNTLTFQNGAAQIRLKHGQQLQIKDLPVKAGITVTEQSVDGYHISYTVNGSMQDAGNVTLTEHSFVDVTNKKSDIAETGITDYMTGMGAGLGIAVIAVLSFGGLAFLRLKKGRKR